MSKKTSKRLWQANMNILMSLIYQVTAAVIGLILPRYVLKTFGSETNGMIQAIDQLLGYTVLLEGGIGGLVVASFYKPLAVGDTEAISDIFNNTKSFFNKIATVYFVFVGILIVFSKVIIRTEVDWIYLSSLVLILGMSNFFSYYFAMSQRLLLRADQKLRIPQFFQTCAIILNAILCILCISMGFGIHVVKAVSMLVFLITPLALRIYVKKHYKIEKKLFHPERALPKKKDGMIHHISYFIHKNTDIVILTVFCGMKEVSVYSVYNVVVVALGNLMGAVSSGLAAMLGNMIALEEDDKLNQTFEIYNAANMTVSSFFCTMLACLLVPFVTIYTDGVTDIDYIRPMFAYLLVISEWFYFIRNPFATTITSAGHYKETRFGAAMEAGLNLILSLLLVRKFQIIGIMIGTLSAMLFRTIYVVWYLSGNILKRGMMKFAGSFLANLVLGVGLTVFLQTQLPASTEHLGMLLLDAIKCSVIVLPAFMVLNLLIHPELLRMIKNAKKIR